MNKFISQIFKSAGVVAKVSKDSANPKFRVVDNKLTLEGIIKNNRYKMSITDNTGEQIDSLSVSVSNTNDVANRISESLNTLKNLSRVYDSAKLVEEDEEFDIVDIESEDDADEPKTLETALSELYDFILDAADMADSLVELSDDTDAEQKSTLISFASKLYDCAIDVDDYRDDMFPQEEDIEESVERVSRGHVQKAIDSLTISESMLRKNPKYKDIVKAIKDIKSELIVR